MKWLCRRNRNNSAVWIAIMTSVFITMEPGQRHVSYGRPWLTGVAVGVAVGLIVVALLMAWKRRCV